MLNFILLILGVIPVVGARCGQVGLRGVPDNVVPACFAIHEIIYFLFYIYMTYMWCVDYAVDQDLV